MIDVADILQVLSQHNFSNQKQIDLLQVLDYALIVKHYPSDIHEIINRKVRLLQQPPDTENSVGATFAVAHNETPDYGVNLKIRIVLLLKMLDEMGISTANTDRTKICNYISLVTGNSRNQIYKQMQKGINFSKFHSKQIVETNKILSELNTKITIDMTQQY